MTEITYTRQGDYNLPNLLPPQEEPVPHGKYALLRKKFLKEHPEMMAEIERKLRLALGMPVEGETPPAEPPAA